MRNRFYTLTAMLSVAASVACASGLPPVPVLVFDAPDPHSGTRFLVKGQEFAAAYRDDEVRLSLRGADVRLRFPGANPMARLQSAGRNPGIVNFFTGQDPSSWVTGLHTYSGLIYRDLYPGIDMFWEPHRRAVKTEFRVAPGTSPGIIRMAYEGVRNIRIDFSGALIVDAGNGRLRDEQPLVYAVSGGERRRVRAKYVITPEGWVGFSVDAYDPRATLIIDPVVSYSTLLGGSGHDSASAIAVDSTGNAYIAGWTESSNFPVTGGLSFGGGCDMFVAKFTSANALAYATFIGGSGDDIATGIGVDASGNAVVTGSTNSSDMPLVKAIQTSLRGGTDVYVAKLNSTGTALTLGTYLGGSSNDAPSGLALDSSGNIYVAGSTSSTNFPVVNPYQSTNRGQQNAFVFKLNPSTPALIYSTYLGGSATGAGNAIAVDSSGSAYVTGYTESYNFPTLTALQSANRGQQTAFVTKFSSSGGTLEYSTYLGGSGGALITPEMGTAIAVDSTGAAYITGVTSSSDFPAVNAYQSANAGSIDAFVAKLNSAGSAIVYSTFLGGTSRDWANSIALDATGAAYICGYAASTDFPTLQPIQSANAGSYDAFVAQFNASGALVFSTYYGGANTDSGDAIAVASSGRILVAGHTMSSNFPLLNPLNIPNMGGYAGFFLVLSSGTPTCMDSVLPNPASLGASGGPFTLMMNAASGCSWTTTSNSSWLHVVNGSGTGNGSISLTADANTSAMARAGTLTVAGQTVTVNQAGSVPLLSITKTHTGTFQAGQTASFQITVSNAAGFGGTSGAVTVTETPGSGLILTSIGGTGWSCNSNVCSRSDTLAGGASYPTLNVTMSVAANAASQVMNQVMVAGGASASATASDTATITTATSPAALGFFPLTPCRMVDTRAGQNKTGSFGPPSLSAYAERDFPLLSSGCGIPSSAVAYSLNFTVAPPAALDFLSTWPAGQPYPSVSTLNSPGGVTLANAAIVPAGSTGAIAVMAAETTDLIIDLNGYFAPPNGKELVFYPLTPCRVVDTRAGQSKSGAFGPPSLQANATRNFPLSGNCGIPSTAVAYSLNFTAVPPGPLGYLSVWPTGQPYPGVSTLNASDGEVLANAAIIQAGTAGSITTLAGNPTDLIVDVNGYFGATGSAGALHFYAITPCRIADTRSSQGKTGAFGPPSLAAGANRNFQVTSSGCGVPSLAQAYSLNITVVPQGPLAYLSAWPAGQGFPGVSTLNSVLGNTIANAAIVPASSGSITVMAASATDLILDINGYFAP